VQQLHAIGPADLCSAKYAWYAFQPGHQPVCQRHSRANKDLGLVSAFFRTEQVSQAKAFCEEGIRLVFIVHSFHNGFSEA
jgi:hypothetical protein